MRSLFLSLIAPRFVKWKNGTGVPCSKKGASPLKPPLLLFLLLAKAIVMGGLIVEGTIGLVPDEAQYWLWSRNLDWGYYSKPLGIAWQAWVGTSFFGDNELGVRFGAIVVSFLLSVAVYFLSRACGLRQGASCAAALALAFSPMGMLGSLLATTDGGFVLFWTVACLAAVWPMLQQKPLNFYWIGLAILCGALFKWPIYLFWLFLLPFAYGYFRSFSTAFPYKAALGGVALSCLGLVPSLIWSLQHDWATFRHVLTTMLGEPSLVQVEKASRSGNFLEFLGAQVVLVSPLLFFLLVVSFIYFWKQRKTLPWPQMFCGGLCFTILVIYLALSSCRKMQGNWCVFAYPSGIVFLTWVFWENVHKGKAWLMSGIAIAVLSSAFLFSIPYVTFPYRLNPFQHYLGWNKLQSALREMGYDPQQHFLFSDKYQTSSILSFYSEGQKRAYFLNLHGSRKNQFSYWPSMAEEQMGQTGFFVWVENASKLIQKRDALIAHYQNLLVPYFKNVQFLGEVPLFSDDKIEKMAFVYKCFDHNGLKPEKTLVY